MGNFKNNNSNTKEQQKIKNLKGSNKILKNKIAKNTKNPKNPKVNKKDKSTIKVKTTKYLIITIIYRYKYQNIYILYIILYKC